MSAAARPPLRLVRSEGVHTFDDVFERYAPYVGKIALRLLGRNDEVDDAVQDVFLVVARHMDKGLPPADELRPWIATIAVRAVGKRLRKRRLRFWLGLDTAGACAVAPGASPEIQALARRLYEVLDTLPAKERTAWILRHFEQQPLDEVAALCGCSLATAKRWIARAQGRVQEVMGHD